ncbi:tetratricopeptide repeat protein [Rhabdochromatium marinum]|uniref:O-linked N-acetylglucosamine transferase, SPINDLY family protein n=1 Tax=Rhabdochromatium marinum TaxID=48729 RepID=UPI0019046FEE|nr:tetratricopeptide repeat protein [Rhabdochromatium marinum]MBK1647603.1 hypothetical protein [Rhabdochromatium marinum]
MMQTPGGETGQLERLLAAQPEDLNTWLTLIETHLQRGEVEAALQAVERAITAIGQHAGRAQLTQLQQTLEIFLRPAAAEADPVQAAACYQQGNQERAQSRPKEARLAYLQALAHNPDDPAARLALAALETEQGQFQQAEYHYRQALERWPDRADVLEPVAGFLSGIDALDEGIALFRRALELNPERAELWFFAANANKALGKAAVAEVAYRSALELNPDYVAAWTNLGELLRTLNRREEAEAAFRRALAIDPHCAVAHQCLGMLLFDLARFDAAHAAFREALACQPDFALAMSNLLFRIGFAVHWSAATMRAEAERWEQVALSAQERQQARARTFARQLLPGRRLRLGVLSSELGHHAVGFFLWPWLSALDRSRCELFLYPTRLRPEPQAASFQALADAWTPLVGLDDCQAAERIRADQIDVLIETSGHTKSNRLGIIAHRVAPVQCHYIGYFATTGLSEMDYFIGDAVFTPPDQDDGFTERVWRLPRSRYAFHSLIDAPEPAWHPDPKGRLWLGSFNQLNKVREDSLALWGEILRALPNAHLFLKNNQADDPLVQDRILRTLAGEGIGADRVKFVGYASCWAEHMGLYNYVDLALDPTPFTSATTGFEALWMGTPLVTLMGEQPATRQAASMLTGLGQPDWIATTHADYVRIALELLRDTERRRHIRTTQRERMRGGELCDGAGLARVLQDAFAVMFEHWQASASSSH